MVVFQSDELSVSCRNSLAELVRLNELSSFMDGLFVVAKCDMRERIVCVVCLGSKIGLCLLGLSV